MFNFFKLGRRAPRDLEQLIYEIAEFQRDEDFHGLYKLMRDRQVFLPVNRDTIPVGPPGSTYTTGPNDGVKVTIITSPDGTRSVLAVTQESSPLLQDGYVGMQWIDVLKMALQLGDEFGVALQGVHSWIIFDQARTKYILETYR